MIKDFLLLHILLFIYSLGGVFSKLASTQNFLSVKFCLFYVCLLVILGIYAIGWQQIIKKMPLTTAFSNKAITIIWGMLWGVLIFNEELTLNNIIGGLVVMIGIIIYTTGDKNE